MIFVAIALDPATFSMATSERQSVQYAGTSWRVLFSDKAQAEEYAAAWNKAGTLPTGYQLSKGKMSKAAFELATKGK